MASNSVIEKCISSLSDDNSRRAAAQVMSDLVLATEMLKSQVPDGHRDVAALVALAREIGEERRRGAKQEQP